MCAPTPQSYLIIIVDKLRTNARTWTSDLPILAHPSDMHHCLWSINSTTVQWKCSREGSIHALTMLLGFYATICMSWWSFHFWPHIQWAYFSEPSYLLGTNGYRACTTMDHLFWCSNTPKMPSTQTIHRKYIPAMDLLTSPTRLRIEQSDTNTKDRQSKQSSVFHGDPTTLMPLNGSTTCTNTHMDMLGHLHTRISNFRW